MSIHGERIIVINVFINAVYMALFKGSIVVLLLSNCKFQAFIISFLSENKSMPLDKVTSEHDLHKPVIEQDSLELHLFVIKER